jgi:glycosyltransferase involved in cell wall biosynthesis
VHYVVCDDWLCYGPALDAWSRLFRFVRPAAPVLRKVLGVPVDPGPIGSSGSFGFISVDTQQRAEAGSRWQFPDAAVVYMGIDGGLFTVAGASGERHEQAEREATDAARTRPWGGRLLYVGRFDPRKGLETLVRGFARLPPSHQLEIQGTGDEAYREHLRALAVELGVAARVDFSARVDRTELAARYRRADCVVFPSEWDEPFGLVPVEAMGCGTPVVATGKGGSGEFLFDDVNCLTYPAGDPDALAAAVERLAAGAELRAQLVSAGFHTAAYFDVERLTDTLEAWTVGAAEGFPAGRPPSRHFGVDSVRFS